MNLRGAARHVVNKIGSLPIKVVEIGVRDGSHAEILLKEMNIDILYLVDHYPVYQDGPYFRNQQDQDNWYRDMFKRMNKYISNTVLLNRDSMFASTLFQDSSIDFVYIDGCHDKEFVKNDLIYWYPKVTIGGVIGGHDFTLREYPGVKEAVIEFSKERGLIYREVEETDWIIDKDI